MPRRFIKEIVRHALPEPIFDKLRAARRALADPILLLPRRIERPLVLVTGADTKRSPALLRLSRSVERFAGERIRFIVYDLGLSEADRKTLSESGREIRSFRFDRYPPFMDIRRNSGQFAWKPQIVWEVMEETRSPTCWMDARNLLIAPLDRLERAVCRDGFYSPHSSGTVAEFSHDSTLAYFGLTRAWGRDKPNRNAACVAFDPESPPARFLAQQWRELAMRQEIIAPEGSNRSNHRRDQTLLTILSYLMRVKTSTAYLGFKTHQDLGREAEDIERLRPQSFR